MRQSLAVLREEDMKYAVAPLYKSMGEYTDFAEMSCQPGVSCSGSAGRANGI